MVANDLADEHHDRERRRLKLTWDQYWYKLAEERVGPEEEQIADVLAQLRAGSYENRVRANTIERLIKSKKHRQLVEVSTIDVRNEFSEHLNQVAYAGKTIVIMRRGKAIAALVSTEDI